MSRERATADVPVPTLGPLLIRARRRLGVSQRDVADRLRTLGAPASVSRHEVSRWEREMRQPSRYWVRWLGVVLRIDPRALAEATERVRWRRVAARSPWQVIEISRAVDSAGAVRLFRAPDPARPVSRRARRAGRAAAAGDPGSGPAHGPPVG